MRTCKERPRIKREHGFTLLELLISITMLSVIFLIVGSAVRLGLRSVDSGERRIGSLERFRASLNIVESQVQSELPVASQALADNSNVVFKGDGESMEFPSNFSLWSGQRGYVTVSYKVSTDAFGKQDLYMEESAVGAEKRGEVKLFEFFDRIYFDYFYTAPTEEKGNWVEQWPDETRVPEKIRLHLVSGDKEMSWIIAIRARDVQNKTTVSAK